MKVLILAFFISCYAIAQHSEQPLKQDDSDMRAGLVMFSVEQKEEQRLMWLERTANLDYFLRMKTKDNKELIRKVDTRDAKKLDMDFASRFLKCQYEIASEAGQCEVQLRLIMKGEVQEICKKDERKAQEFAPFVDTLKKRF